MIFFPDNIQKIQREDMEGIKEDFYHYDLIKIPDKGQQIDDYEKFQEENAVELTKYAGGKWKEIKFKEFVFEKSEKL